MLFAATAVPIALRGRTDSRRRDRSSLAGIAHPIYSAMLGLLVGTGLTFSTLSATAVAVVLYYVGAIVRVRAEERLLAAAFGQTHADYLRRVPAILPRLW